MTDTPTKNPFSRLDTALMRSTKTDEQPQKSIPERPNARTPVHPNGRTPERPGGKRITTRESFDIYEDQMATLRDISWQEKREGKLGSMSAMVREALDTYLAKRTAK
jgi:hypothetical protein